MTHVWFEAKKQRAKKAAKRSFKPPHLSYKQTVSTSLNKAVVFKTLVDKNRERKRYHIGLRYDIWRDLRWPYSDFARVYAHNCAFTTPVWNIKRDISQVCWTFTILMSISAVLNELCVVGFIECNCEFLRNIVEWILFIYFILQFHAIMYIGGLNAQTKYQPTFGGVKI